MTETQSATFTNSPRSNRKARDIAVVIPVLLICLVMPPLITITALHEDGSLFGIPLVVYYLFGIWILAIIATALNNRRLTSSPQSHRDLLSSADDPLP